MVDGILVLFAFYILEIEYYMKKYKMLTMMIIDTILFLVEINN